MTDIYGGEEAIRLTTNVVYSNGFLDQWSSAGITAVNRTDSVSLMIEDGAHHLDLMFSHPDDPPSVTRAREVERRYIAHWVDAWWNERGLATPVAL